MVISIFSNKLFLINVRVRTLYFRYNAIAQLTDYSIGKKVKISLLQAVEAPTVAKGRGSHIT
jgi:hypothetical protein